MGEETVEKSFRKSQLSLIGFTIFIVIGFLSFIIWFLLTQVNDEHEEKFTYKIPEWVKANAGWWSEGHISDEEFSFSLQWLFDHGLIETKECIDRCL